MISKFIKYFTFLLAGILIFSCEKDSESFKPYGDTGQVLNLIEKINDQTESYLFEAQNDYTVATKNSVIINYTKNSLVNAAGESVTGNVKLVFNEIISAGQSILLGGSTKVNDKIFSSVSLLKVVFEDDKGNKLSLKNNASIEIYHPRSGNDLKPNLRMYRGLTVDNTVNWNEISNPVENNNLEETNWEVETNIGLVFGYGYKYNTSKLGWHALGDYLDTDGVDTKELCVDLPELFNKDNTKVFFVFEDLISIVDLHTFRTEDNLFCGSLTNLNESENNYIITLSSTESGDYYFGFYNNPKATSTLLIEPKKSTIEEISQFLYER